MKRSFAIVTLCCALGLSGQSAFAADDVSLSTETVQAQTQSAGDEFLTIFKQVVEAGKDGQARLVVAGVLMLLVFAWRRWASGLLIGKIPATYLPLVMAGVAMLSEMAMSLSLKDGFNWGSWALNSFLTGAASMAMWSTVGKLVLPKMFGSAEQPKPPAEQPPTP